MKKCKKNCKICGLATFKSKGIYCESKGEFVRESLEKKDYGKVYKREKAIALLNEIVNTAKDLTSRTLVDEKYEINGDLFAEIYNFLVNNNLRG